MTIGLFKLTSGEEVVATFSGIEGHPTDVLLSKPRKMMLMPTGPSSFDIRMLPWIIGHVDGEFPVSLGNVMTMIEAPAKLEELYTKQVSQIALASADSPLIK